MKEIIAELADFKDLSSAEMTDVIEAYCHWTGDRVWCSPSCWELKDERGDD